MALMFPWATKEYLLWNMTIGQIIMYHNKAMDIKNGTKSSSYKSKSAGELKKIRDNILSGVEEAEKERQAQEMRRKYGDV
jgi:signal transduction histidine kinase